MKRFCKTELLGTILCFIINTNGFADETRYLAPNGSFFVSFYSNCNNQLNDRTIERLSEKCNLTETTDTIPENFNKVFYWNQSSLESACNFQLALSSNENSTNFLSSPELNCTKSLAENHLEDKDSHPRRREPRESNQDNTLALMLSLVIGIPFTLGACLCCCCYMAGEPSFCS